jgi:NADH-quinone oxidoreductase subunit A
MLTAYAPILVLLAAILAFAVGNMVLSDVVGRTFRNSEKASPYECGMDPIGSARVRLSIHFYLVAVLFIVFDVEALFIVLWAGSVREFAAAGLGMRVFAAVFLFVFVLAATLFYEWRKGGLEWDR